MRIFQVIEASATGGYSSGQIWLRNLYEPLVEMGHEVVLYRAEAGRRIMRTNDRAARLHFSQQIFEAFERENRVKSFDLFFSYLMDGMVLPELIDEVKAHRVPTCNFSCNNSHQFNLVDELSPHFDYNLHSEKDVAPKFRAIGATPIWFPMAANPKYYHPNDLPIRWEVSFVGQCYARRPNYLLHLLENGINVHAFGPEWLPRPGKNRLRSLRRWLVRTFLLLNALRVSSAQDRYSLTTRVAWLDGVGYLRSKYLAQLHSPLTDDEMIRNYSESKISLGFLEVFDAHNSILPVKQHLHLREFEAPMSGALYLTGWCEELEEFYEPEKELITYRNEHELLDKARYYLAHPDAAQKVRVAGRARALRDHTYHQRYLTLFSQLGLKSAGAE